VVPARSGASGRWVIDIALLASKAGTFLVEAPLPKDPDRSHLADAIHFMDLIDLADEELPAAKAAVERSKAAAVTARMDLEKHQQWLGTTKNFTQKR
jgi:hypothetical protein